MLTDGSRVRLKTDLVFWLAGSSKYVVPAGALGTLRRMKPRRCCDLNGRYACDVVDDFVPTLHRWMWGVEFDKYRHPHHHRWWFFGYRMLSEVEETYVEV